MILEHWWPSGVGKRQFSPIWQQLPALEKVSIIVPDPMYAPIFIKHGIKTAFFPIKDPLLTGEFGSILNPAFANSFLPQPAVFPFTKCSLSYHDEYGPDNVSIS